MREICRLYFTLEIPTFQQWTFFKQPSEYVKCWDVRISNVIFT